jgi:hypothetical protein
MSQHVARLTELFVILAKLAALSALVEGAFDYPAAWQPAPEALRHECARVDDGSHEFPNPATVSGMLHNLHLPAQLPLDPRSRTTGVTQINLDML